MKYRLLDLLRCPDCNNILELYSLKENKELTGINGPINSLGCREYCGLKGVLLNHETITIPMKALNCRECYRAEIIDGLLECKCGKAFPIMDGVPRFIGNLPSLLTAIAHKYSDAINKSNCSYLLEKEARYIRNE